MKFLRLLVLCLSLCVTLFGQTVVVTQTNAPLKITDTANWPAEPDHNATIRMNVQNVSGQSIEAYGLVATRIDDAGTPLTTTTHLALVSTVPGKNLIEPDETRSDKISAPAGAEGHIALKIDYVKFDDGTQWGPDTMRFAEAVSQLRTGALLKK